MGGQRKKIDGVVVFFYNIQLLPIH